MKDRLLNIAGTMAVAPAAIFGMGVENNHKNVCVDPNSTEHHLQLQSETEQRDALENFRLSDLPWETKLVITAGAALLVIRAHNSYIHQEEYQNDRQKKWDPRTFWVSAAVGATIIAATWAPTAIEGVRDTTNATVEAVREIPLP